jgi:hypothetical protein
MSSIALTPHTARPRSYGLCGGWGDVEHRLSPPQGKAQEFYILYIYIYIYIY